MEASRIALFSEKETPRLRYIADLVIGDILGLKYEIITRNEIPSDVPVINYSSENVPGSFRIPRASLLYESGTRAQDISVNYWNELPVFFSAGGADIPFDILAASFYMVSRYEEYLDFEPDKHGRFPASAGLALKNNFLGIPVVDLWAHALSSELTRKFPGLVLKKNEFKTLVTVDSDEPFAYLGKNLFQSAGGFVRDILKAEAIKRYNVVFNKKRDPNDVFGYISSEIEQSGTKAAFFFPTGERSSCDANPSWRDKDYRRLIRDVSSKYDTGIHPSYNSYPDEKVLFREIERLRIITGKEITLSRFHYIRFSFPSSFRKLLKAGIEEDYSMGFPEEPGFRAGIARPFFFYDISEEVETRVKIIPFQVMDATLYQYKNLDAGSSAIIIDQLIEQTRKAGGLFVSLWHNTTLPDIPGDRGWRRLFESIINTH